MSTTSRIEWTERTWNPVIGCKKVSQGCKHCYAETLSRRLRAMGAAGYEQEFSEVRCMPNRLEDPLRVKAPSLWFVNSMSDLFQEDVEFNFIDQVFDTMRTAPQHTFQVLTKRPARMLSYFASRPDAPDNVWLGTSVENRSQGVPRIAQLREVPAKVRFISAEPLLEDLGPINLRGIHWVIVGGESGHGARPMQPPWVENIKHQCDAQNVAFFFKQWGAWGPDGIRRSKSRNGRALRGRTWDAMPIPT